MSLFPSASNDQISTTTEGHKDDVKKINRKWLENTSFSTESSAALQQIFQKDDKNKNLYKFEQEFQEIPAKKRKIPLDEESSISSGSDNEEMTITKTSRFEKDEEILEDNIFVDRSSDKNNLYFQKPYKVAIPRFYRSSTVCIGLPPWLQIKFKEDRKKMKLKRKEDRYFHIDPTVKKNQEQQQEADPSLFIKNEVEELNVKTRENPQDEDLWMQLVNLQDKMHCKSVKLIVEKKVAILDKAIAANPKSFNLKLSRLKLLENILQDAERDWKNLVFQHPESRFVWEAYIAHTMTLTTFTVHRTLKVFEKCLQTLSALRHQTFRTADFVREVDCDMISIFKHLTTFLVEAGLTEHVISLMILMLEINIRTDQCSDLSDVEHFYKSGNPLLGEPKSLGWNEWFEKYNKGGWQMVTQTVKEEDDDDDEEEDVDIDKSVEENWLNIEAQRGKKHLLPWRHQEECEDPSRKISFDDLKGSLFLVQELKNKLELLKMFVQIIGTNTEESSRSLLLNQPCQLTHACQCNDAAGDIAPLSSITCRGGGCCYGVLPRKPHHQLLSLIFEQIATVCPLQIRKEIGPVCLNYFAIRLSIFGTRDKFKQEVKKTGKEARKLAKNILKSDPMNFLLWSKLAEVEYSAGNHDECMKIYHNALCMCKDQSDAFLLCQKYSKLLYKNNPGLVKKVLCALGDGQKFAEYLQQQKDVTGAAQLRASRSMERLCEELGCLYQQVANSRSDELSFSGNAMYCHCTCIMLTSSTEIKKVFGKYIQIVRKTKEAGSCQAAVDLKALHCLKISHISHDYQHCNQYRNALLSALDDFPGCPQFAVKLCEIEVGSSLTSIARRIFAPFTSDVTAFFSIFFELLRLERAGTQNCETMVVTPRVLHLLERTVIAHPQNILLWRTYAVLSKRPADILTRASAACPWSKAIACDRIRQSTCNIDDVIKFMQDKGVRVRTPVEEIRLLLAM
ncbi:unnamed protein product [Clavelina lepadiformis]|uniref:Protein NRDE2 homolog n=1 Tax=Clavelina lepadiformis TaxID=159417 RepID=A0ABP0GTZ4_CLALP